VFTGIIEELGTVRRIEVGDGPVRLGIGATEVVSDALIGDSIAINGVCLTVVSVDESGFEVDVIPESLDRSTLGALKPGSIVNLERPLRIDGRLDGHIVQGHVDGLGRITAVESDGAGGFRMSVGLAESLARSLVEKGSITIDGVSLTVSAVADEGFEVALIPHTLEVTTLGDRGVGDMVNLEIDVIAKYVARYLDTFADAPRALREST